MFVEEAAELLESHIVAALTKETQHLILIGKFVSETFAVAHIVDIVLDVCVRVASFQCLVVGSVASLRLCQVFLGFFIVYMAMG